MVRTINGDGGAGLPNIRFELARCANWNGGFRHWLGTYVQVESPTAGVTPFEMWPCHVEAVDALEQYSRLIVLKARQIGMSWLFGCAYPLWIAQFHPNQLALLFSRRDNEVAELIRRCRFIWARQPQWMQVPLGRDNELELGFEGMDSRIIGFPANPDAGSGYTARYVFSDEHAKQPYAEDQFAAIRPTIDHGGQIVLNSTARGTGNFYHRMWEGADWSDNRGGEGRNGFKALFFDYAARPGRTPEWWERMRETFPDEAQFFQEYPRDPDEAFQSSVARPINAAFLKLRASCTEPLTTAKNQEFGGLLSIRPKYGEAGFRLYQEPVLGHSYVIGADVAEGFAGGDAQAAVVLDQATGEEVAVLHGRWPIEQYAAYLDHLAQAFGALLAPERNNHGNALIVHLLKRMQRRGRQKDRCKYRLYYEKPALSRLGKEPKPALPGWLTTNRTKPLLFTDLSEALATVDIRLATPHVLAELKSLAIDADGKIGAEEGGHDDLAIACAIAWQMVIRTPRPRPRPQVPVAIGQHPGQLLSNWEQLQMAKRNRMLRHRRDLVRGAGGTAGARPTMLQRIGTAASAGSAGVTPRW